ncbi:NAD(P)-binding domain-containing protein [Ancylobacter sp. 6x-1]|uniref:Pyrroline-5-carboxylate reductase n=1 Tax=Ancylobacter crimeensis TaxID=2579147 RepID=A0ABT0DB65_9HYPH|nr:pyrroline-5-carboxylate reductase dimerization domain-containing protein [Ancylobacter crimeensis]MCK0197206.1 NAD(P)-binding domain-containing protein [Ancylobacter crimeensis]
MATGIGRIGIIGGSGWLGAAFAQAFLEKGLVAPEALTLSNRTGSGPIAGVTWTSDNQALVERSDIVILSVRPEQFLDLSMAAGDRVLLSFMAGVTIETLRARTGARRIVRTMPNAAATIGACFTPWFATPEVGPDDKARVQALLEACGSAGELGSEDEIDYVSGFTGAGPALPALLARAMIQHATARGLPPALARQAALSVVTGAAQLLAEKDADPSAIMDALIGYRGITAALLETAMAGGFESLIGTALAAGEARAREMSARSAGSGGNGDA